MSEFLKALAFFLVVFVALMAGMMRLLPWLSTDTGDYTVRVIRQDAADTVYHAKKVVRWSPNNVDIITDDGRSVEIYGPHIIEKDSK